MKPAAKWILGTVIVLGIGALVFFERLSPTGLIGAIGAGLAALAGLLFGTPAPTAPKTSPSDAKKAQEVADNVQSQIDASPASVVVQQYGGDGADQQRTNDVSGIIAGLEKDHLDGSGTQGGT